MNKEKGKPRWMPFEEAKELVRSLHLKGDSDWRKYCKSGDKPVDVPVAPEKVYKDEGWKGLGDWLGTGNIAPHYRKFRSFEEARKFARSLGLKGDSDWRKYCKSGDKPVDVPVAPDKVYKDKGWINMGDWLGTGNIATQQMQFLPFAEAREFARKLKLKNFRVGKVL
jgi:Phage-integrase repeat unit